MADDIDNLDVSTKLTKEQRDRVEYARLEREEMGRSYDLAKLFSSEIKKQEAILDKVTKYHADLSARLEKQKELIEKTNRTTNLLALKVRETGEALQSQVGVVAAQLDVVKELDAQYARTAATRKMMGDALKDTYSEINNEENKLLKLQEERQAKENAFGRLQQRNLEYGKIRENLARDYEKAVLAGLNKEAAAIRVKQNLIQGLIQFSSDEMDANRTRVGMLDKQIDASKILLKEKRKQAEEEENVVDNLGKELRVVSQKRVLAKQELANQESILEKKQAEHNVSKNLFALNFKKLQDMREEAERMKAMLGKYERMREAVKKKIEYLKTAKIVVGEIDNFLGQQSEYYGKTKALIMDIAKGGATAWLAVIKASLDRWIELDRAALGFRKQTGFLVNQTKELDKAAREVNVQMANLGVNIEEAYAAAGALTEEFQVIGLVTKESIANTAMVAANLGIGVAESAKIKGMFESIAESTGTTGDGLIKSAAALAKMGGVAPSVVMKDIASASGETLSFLAKSPIALMRAAVEARRLGTTVANMSKSARGFLNYQDSITSELEASALLGKALNFQEARAAAYAGDVVKSRQLALEQIAKAGDFTKLNVYQQEALARAAGMTVDEIIKQQNQQKLLAKLEATRPELYAKYKAMQDKLRENEKAATEDLEKQAEEMAKQQLMQGEMNKLTNAFRAIWTDITDALLPIANAIMPIIIFTARLLAGVFKIIGGLVKGLLAPVDKIFSSFRSGNKEALKLEEIMVKVNKAAEWLAGWAEKIGTFFGYILQPLLMARFIIVGIGNAGSALAGKFKFVEKVYDFFKLIGDKISTFGSKFGFIGKIGGSIGKMIGLIGKAVGMVAKFLGPIGVIINVAQLIFSIFKRFSEIEWGDSIGENILLGIKAIGGALYDVLIQPFVDLWDWVSDKIMGKSPSKLGLGIVEGIKSIGSMLLDALTWPFRTALDFISGVFGGDGDLGTTIIEGIKSIGGFIFDALAWPFKKLIKFASKIPIIGKLFGGGNVDGSIDVATEARTKAEASTTPSVEVKGIPELKESIDKLTEAITKLGGAAGGAAPIVNVNNNPAAMVEKIDELIDLLREGAIGVNIDGIKASKVLARASS